MHTRFLVVNEQQPNSAIAFRNFLAILLPGHNYSRVVLDGCIRQQGGVPEGRGMEQPETGRVWHICNQKRRIKVLTYM